LGDTQWLHSRASFEIDSSFYCRPRGINMKSLKCFPCHIQITLLHFICHENNYQLEMQDKWWLRGIQMYLLTLLS
jgi:hypothetical protein